MMAYGEMISMTLLRFQTVCSTRIPTSFGVKTIRIFYVMRGNPYGFSTASLGVALRVRVSCARRWTASESPVRPRRDDDNAFALSPPSRDAGNRVSFDRFAFLRPDARFRFLHSWCGIARANR